jgi:hypothetical protein
MADQIAFLIEFEHGRGGGAALRNLWTGGGVLFAGLERAAAMDNPDVVVRIDRDADGLAKQPVVRQRLGPHRVDFEPRRLGSTGGMYDGALLEQGRSDSESDKHSGERDTDTEITFHDGYPPFWDLSHYI